MKELNSFEESNITGKSTEEIDSISYNSNMNSNKVQSISQFKAKTDQELNNIIHDIFFVKKEDVEEFDDLSGNFNESFYKIKETNMVGKKHTQDNSVNSFSQIKKVKNNKKMQKSKEKIFEINKMIKKDMPTYRLDYFKKIFVKSVLRYLLNRLKQLILKCNFDENIIKQKLHMPNYKLYAGNPKEKDNKEFLEKTIKKVFTDYDKKNQKGNGRQIANEKLINKIYEIDSFPSSEDEFELNEFFNMTIEKGVELFYESKDFENFKKDELIQYYDKIFYKERNRNFYLLEKNGFIKLVKEPFYSKTPK